MNNVVFITGTDTGVGKTVFTALLLTHLRQMGQHALALKPFCSGGSSEVEILGEAQGWEISKRQINPFYFDDPVAPLVALRRTARSIPWHEVLDQIRSRAQTCQILLVEGAGGLLVPLVEKRTIADLIAALKCRVVLVARNKLGTVNHTLLTLEALRSRAVLQTKVVLMDQRQVGLAGRTNASLIREFAIEKVFQIPFLGSRPCAMEVLVDNATKLKSLLTEVLESKTVSKESDGAGMKKGKRFLLHVRKGPVF